MQTELLSDEQRLVKINEELRYQQSINPLPFQDLLPIQKLFITDQAKTRCLFGGNRAGKTQAVAYYVLKKAIERPNQRIWCVAETYQDSIAVQQKKIWDLCPKNRIKYGRYNEINGFTNRKLLFDNNTLLVFKSYDQSREQFQGDTIDICWLDEEPGFDIYQECRMRLIDRDGEMLLSMTALKGITDLIADIYEGHEVVESQYAQLVDKELPRIAEKGDFRFYHLWTIENKYINQKRVLEEANLLPRDEKICRIFGIPLNLQGKIYMQMNRDIHVTAIDEMPEGQYTIYNVLDPHDRKPWAISWIAVHKTGSAYVIDEYPDKPFVEMKYDDKTYADYATVIRQKERWIKDMFGCDVTRRIIDPNFGNKTVQLAQRQGGNSTTTPKKQLAALGLKYKDGIDALEAGHLAVREWLHYEQADNGELIVAPKLMFCDNCTNHITGMMRYSRKDINTSDGDEKNKVAPMDKWKDFPDCVRYGVMSGLRFLEDFKDEEFKKVY